MSPLFLLAALVLAQCDSVASNEIRAGVLLRVGYADDHIPRLIVTDFSDGGRFLVNSSIVTNTTFWDAVGVDQERGVFFHIDTVRLEITSLRYRDPGTGLAMVPKIEARANLSQQIYTSSDAVYDSEMDCVYVSGGNDSSESVWAIDASTGKVSLLVTFEQISSKLSLNAGLRLLYMCFNDCYEVNITDFSQAKFDPLPSNYSWDVTAANSAPAVVARGSTLGLADQIFESSSVAAPPFQFVSLPSMPFNQTMEWGYWIQDVGQTTARFAVSGLFQAQGVGAENGDRLPTAFAANAVKKEGLSSNDSPSCFGEGCQEFLVTWWLPEDPASPPRLAYASIPTDTPNYSFFGTVSRHVDVLTGAIV